VRVGGCVVWRAGVQLGVVIGSQFAVYLLSCGHGCGPSMA